MLGFREPFDFGGHKQAVNKILRAALSHYGDPFGVISAQYGIEPVDSLQNAPALLDLLEAAGLIKTGRLTKNEALTLSGFIDSLITILLRAHEGDEEARSQLEAIDKVVNPARYELPPGVFKDLAKSYHTSPARARGWALRNLMRRLADVAVTTRPGAKNILDGPIKITLRQGAEQNDVYPLIVKHWKPGTTLQSLAIRVYLEQLKDEGFEGIDERSLRRDLAAVAKWDESNLKDWWAKVRQDEENPPSWRLLPSQDFSEGWKLRQRKHRGSSSDKHTS